MSRHHGRNIDGVLLLDKYSGLSSNSALQKVKHLYNANRAGHVGSLDPLATGMLPICLGQATKFAQYLLVSDKRYRVIARLGKRTNTADSEGIVINERSISFTPTHLAYVLNSFRGESMQIPSMYSAIKYNGRKLYEYARKGITIKRNARRIFVYNLQFIRQEEDQLELELHVSKGTYIRTIIDDIGEQLGCGAHIIYLRRLQVANYSIKNMVTLKQLENLAEETFFQKKQPYELLDALLMPIYTPVITYPVVNLLDRLEIIHFKQGMPIQVKNIPNNHGMIRVTEGYEEKFIGMAKIINSGQLIQPHRLVIENSSNL